MNFQEFYPIFLRQLRRLTQDQRKEFILQRMRNSMDMRAMSPDALPTISKVSIFLNGDESDLPPIFFAATISHPRFKTEKCVFGLRLLELNEALLLAQYGVSFAGASDYLYEFARWFKGDNMPFTEREKEVFRTILATGSMSDAAQKLNISGTRIYQIARKLPRRLLDAINADPRKTERNKIDFNTLETRTVNVLRANRVLYWEEAYFAYRQLYMTRNCGRDSYELIRAKVLEYCGKDWQMPTWEDVKVRQ